MALDFYEERKWKKACCFCFSKNCSQEVKKKEENKKLDSLYIKCLNLNSSLKDTNNTSSLSLNNDNKNKNQLIFICKKDNEYIINEILKWKICIKQLENKLKESKSQKIEKFLKILNEVGNIIKIQEENIKRIDNDEKKKQELKDESQIFSLSEYALQLQTSLCSSSNNPLGYGQDSQLDFKTLHKKITNLLDEISGEINHSIETTIYKNNTFDSNKKNNSINNIETNSINNNNNTIKNYISNNLSNNISTSSSSNSLIKKKEENKNIKNKSEEEIIDELTGNNIFTLIFKFGENLTSDDIINYLGKVHNTEKIEELPTYDYKKIQNEQIDLNSVKYDYENVFFKAFPSIFFNDNSSKNKKLIEKDIIPFKSQTKKKKLTEEEQKEIISKLTPLQKLVYIWGISLYGKNEFILNDICNMFSFTTNINLDNEDIEFIIDKILDEINVDMLASNFNALTVNTFNNVPNNIESPIHITTTSRFNYNNQLKDFFSGNIKTLTNAKEIEEKYKLPKYSFGTIEKKNINYNNINFINKNPLFENIQIKQKYNKEVINQIIKYCDEVKEISERNISQYDYYGMKEIMKSHNSRENKVNDIKCYDKIKIAKNTKLNRTNVLNDLKSNIEPINVKMTTEKVLTNQSLIDNRNNERPRIMEVLSFFCNETIDKEWKQLRTTWYQNNSKFNTKYRKGKFDLIQNQNRNQINQNNQHINMNRNGIKNIS